MLQSTKRVPALFVLLLIAACATSTAYQPEWLLNRPYEPGTLHGVGRCGKTERPSRARELAIQRAVAEICYQARGKCDYQIKYKEETEEGTVTVEIQSDGRTVHTLSGIKIIDERFYPAADDGYSQDTTYVLVRIADGLLPW